MDTDHESSGSPEPAVARLKERLSQARVSATSPKGIVKVVYNGHGDGMSMELKPGSKNGYSPPTMAGFVTAALRAADRAVDALHQHTVGEIETAGVSLAQWRETKPTASMDVMSCFQGKA